MQGPSLYTDFWKQKRISSVLSKSRIYSLRGRDLKLLLSQHGLLQPWNSLSTQRRRDRLLICPKEIQALDASSQGLTKETQGSSETSVILVHSPSLRYLVHSSHLPSSSLFSRIRGWGAEMIEKVKSIFGLPIPSLFVGSYSERFLQFCSKWGGGEPGWGKEGEQPSVTCPAWLQGSWEGVYRKMQVGNSSISLQLQIRANWGGRDKLPSSRAGAKCRQRCFSEELLKSGPGPSAPLG